MKKLQSGSRNTKAVVKEEIVEEEAKEAIEKAKQNRLVEEGLDFRAPQASEDNIHVTSTDNDIKSPSKRPSWLTFDSGTTPPKKRRKQTWSKKLVEVSIHSLSPSNLLFPQEMKSKHSKTGLQGC